jgi:hypothetical protein
MHLTPALFPKAASSRGQGAWCISEVRLDEGQPQRLDTRNQTMAAKAKVELWEGVKEGTQAWVNT